jgi:threonine aldolase
MPDSLNRRSFLLGAAPTALMAASLTQHDLFAQTAVAAKSGLTTPAAVAALPPANSRTVYFASDYPNISPEDHLRMFATALAKHPGKEDTYLRGGAVTELEQKFAAMFGKEDCVFMPTGTLVNNLAARILCGDHKHLITQADSHLYADESDGPSVLSGITMQPVAPGKGAPSFEEFEAAVKDAEHRAYPLKVGAISMESPVRRHNGESIPFSTVEKVCAMAKSKGIGTHWDGARAFMLLGTPGFDLAHYAAPFDTVFASLYKALHAPFGGMLMGTKEKMAEARDLRHVFGGLIYHGWVAALPALNAVDGLSERWIDSRAAAEQILAKLQTAGGYTVERVPNESNIVLLRPSEARAKGLQERLLAADIRIAPIRNGTTTFFINETVLHRTPDEIAKAFLA